jgi:hypothetical protein
LFRRPATSALALLLVGAACGSRSELFPEPPAPGAIDDGGVAGADATSPPDDVDAGLANDASPGEDVVFGDDVTADAPLVPIDAALPEAGVTCNPADPTDTVAYLVSQAGTFYSFDPASLLAVPLTTLDCPAGSTSAPFTMTVTEDAAYVMYQDSELDRVDLSTFACTATSFDSAATAFQGPFGLASAYDGAKEWLYIYGCTNVGGVCEPALARADLQTFAISPVGLIAPLPPTMMFPADMKSDGYGRLFAIDFPGTLLEIDPTNAQVLGFDETGFSVAAAEALLTWNGTLYLFGSTSGLINIYDLSTQKLTQVGEVGDAIVGAGSAPCVH